MSALSCFAQSVFRHFSPFFFSFAARRHTLTHTNTHCCIHINASEKVSAATPLLFWTAVWICEPICWRTGVCVGFPVCVGGVGGVAQLPPTVQKEKNGLNSSIWVVRRRKPQRSVLPSSYFRLKSPQTAAGGSLTTGATPNISSL